MELSRRLEEILSLICEGLTNYQIGRRLGLSEITVKIYVTQLYAKLGVQNRVEATKWGRAHGYNKGESTKLLPFYKLTVLQAEVVSCVVLGLKDREIAELLGVSVGAIESRLRGAAAHLGESRRARIATAYLRFIEQYPDFSWRDTEKDPDKAAYWGIINGFEKELPSELPFDRLKKTELEVVQYFAQGMTKAEILERTGHSEFWFWRCTGSIHKQLGEHNRYVIAHVYNLHNGILDIGLEEQEQSPPSSEQAPPLIRSWQETPGDLALLRQFLDILDRLCRGMKIEQVSRELGLHRQKVSKILRHFYPWLEARSFDELIYKGRLHNLGTELPASLPFDKLNANELDVVRCIARHMTDAEMREELTLSVDGLGSRIGNVYRLLGERNRYIIAHVYNESEVLPTAREMPLTPKLQEVLRLLSQGLSNFKIAMQLGVSEETVKTHNQRLYQRLGVRSRAEAVEWARANGFDGKVPPPQLPFEVLSQQDLRVVKYLAGGMKNAEIGTKIGVNEAKVKKILMSIGKQLGERSRYKIAAAYKTHLDN